MSKRKADTHRNNTKIRNTSPQSSELELDRSLFIQAHEADIIRGPRGHAAALALQVRIVDDQEIVGEGLIRWGAEPEGTRYRYEGEDDSHSRAAATEEGKDTAIWVDRYDARLLLEAWNTPTRAQELDRASPTGWSDLPSDTEDTFFLSPDEIEDFHRDKRRRMIERGREERLRAMQAEYGEEEPKEEDEWGASDEEPEEPQRELIRRTAQHVMSSPNPAQLEMRILANHGADKRFAFLRGRWSRAWKTAKGRIRIEQEEEKRKKAEEETRQLGLGGLSGYGDSEESDTEQSNEKSTSDYPPTTEEETVDDGAVLVSAVDAPPSSTTEDDAVKEARRARAREWAEKRRAKA